MSLPIQTRITSLESIGLLFTFPKEAKQNSLTVRAMLHLNYIETLPKVLKKHSKQGYVYNGQRLQGIASKTCGPYAIHYVMHRANGVQRNKILSHFSKDDLMQNDKNVNEWIQKNELRRLSSVVCCGGRLIKMSLLSMYIVERYAICNQLSVCH